MSDNTFFVKIPSIDDFEMRYYFSTQDTMYEARTFPPHVHDEIEVYVLLDGDASFMVENKLYRLQSGDALIAKPNEMHNCILNSTSVHKHLCFWFNPNVSLLFERFTAQKFGENHRVSPSDEDKKELFALCEKLSDYANANNPLSAFSLAVRLVALLQKNLGENAEEKSRDPLPDLLKDILKDLNENFAVIPSLDYFKEKYFLSQSTLNRLFKKYLHTTPNHYLETKKLAHSRILLQKGKSVFDACLESGFSDYSNYIRLFKKRFHVTPKQYIQER